VGKAAGNPMVVEKREISSKMDVKLAVRAS
jgi:hypothetical protein